MLGPPVRLEQGYQLFSSLSILVGNPPPQKKETGQKGRQSLGDHLMSSGFDINLPMSPSPPKSPGQGAWRQVAVERRDVKWGCPRNGILPSPVRFLVKARGGSTIFFNSSQSSAWCVNCSRFKALRSSPELDTALLLRSVSLANRPTAPAHRCLQGELGPQGVRHAVVDMEIHVHQGFGSMVSFLGEYPLFGLF